MPYGFIPTPYTGFPSTTVGGSTNTASTISAGGFDWGSNISNWMSLVPNIIASSKGNPFASGQFGQGSQPTYASGPGGQGVYAGGSFLGASGFGNISGTTLILIGLAAFMILKRK